MSAILRSPMRLRRLAGDTLLTGFGLAIVLAILVPASRWAFTTARWEVIPANLRLFLIGQYPSAIAGETDYLWRIQACLFLLSFLILLTWLSRRRVPGLRRMLPIIWLIVPPLVFFLIRGVGQEYPLDAAVDPSSWISLSASIPTRFWGGLMLSLLLSIAGILFSFPIGILLALGRRSRLPVVRTLSIMYIETIRGVPLISLLFMGQVMINLFLPPGISFDRLIRAVIPITLFSAAYLAENVRGGLQAVSRGQVEAAQALGLNGMQTTLLIVLPQALRAVIPPMVGQFISLFKDTSLVSIVGLLDLLGIARGVMANPDYIGTAREVLLFISLFYFVFSFALGYASRRLEISLGVGLR